MRSSHLSRRHSLKTSPKFQNLDKFQTFDKFQTSRYTKISPSSINVTFIKQSVQDWDSNEKTFLYFFSSLSLSFFLSLSLSFFSLTPKVLNQKREEKEPEIYSVNSSIKAINASKKNISLPVCCGKK